MKLTDGTILTVRQAPPEDIKALLGYFGYIYTQQAEIGVERYMIRFASALQPYTSINATNELLAVLSANPNDAPRILAAVLDMSVTEIPAWIRTPILDRHPTLPNHCDQGDRRSLWFR